jgi:hypothetical protein
MFIKKRSLYPVLILQKKTKVFTTNVIRCQCSQKSDRPIPCQYLVVGYVPLRSTLHTLPLLTDPTVTTVTDNVIKLDQLNLPTLQIGGQKLRNKILCPPYSA